MHKAAISTKISIWLQSVDIQLMPQSWGSQQILSTPPQPTWGTDNISIQGHTHIFDIFSFECTFLGNFLMHWCHSLTLRITAKTHIYTIEYLLCFLLIVVSFLTYLIIFTPDKTYWSPSWHWHNFLTSIIKVKTQTRFMVLFTSGSSLTWGNLQVLYMASPPGIYLLSTPNNQLLMPLQRFYDDRICILCQQGRQMGWQHEGSLG